MSVKTPYRFFTSVCMVHFSTYKHVFLFVYHLFATDGFFRWLIIMATSFDRYVFTLQCKLPSISLQRYQWLYSKRNMVYWTLCRSRLYCKLTLCRLQSRLQHMYHGQPPFPDSTLSPCQGLRIWPRCRFADQSPIRATKNILAWLIKTLLFRYFFRHVRYRGIVTFLKSINTWSGKQYTLYKK